MAANLIKNSFFCIQPPPSPNPPKLTALFTRCRVVYFRETNSNFKPLYYGDWDSFIAEKHFLLSLSEASKKRWNLKRIVYNQVVKKIKNHYHWRDNISG